MTRRFTYALLVFLLFTGACGHAAQPLFLSESSPPTQGNPPAGIVKPTPTPVETETPKTPEPTPSPVYSARVAFTGDLMVHEWQLSAAYRRDSDTYMFTSFDEITPYLTDADYTVGNLETTLAGKDAGYATYPLFNTPDAFAEAIHTAGYDFVSTANNHCYDKGEKGVLRTLSVLDSLGLSHTGTFASAEAAEQIFIKEINHIKFAFLSYTYGTNGITVAADKPYLVSRINEEQIRRQIEQARLYGADVVVMLPHMGNEYELKPSANFVELARNFCLWGADAVMASHPHVLQPVEVFEVANADGTRRTCFIAYSMGNFISSQRTTPRDAGAVFYLTYEKDGSGQIPARLTGAAFTPTWVKFNDAQGRYDIRVLPVYETLQAVDNGTDMNLRTADIIRLRAVHRETTRMQLGVEVPPEEIMPRYVLYSAEELSVYELFKLYNNAGRWRDNRISDQLAGDQDAVPSVW